MQSMLKRSDVLKVRICVAKLLDTFEISKIDGRKLYEFPLHLLNCIVSNGNDYRVCLIYWIKAYHLYNWLWIKLPCSHDDYGISICKFKIRQKNLKSRCKCRLRELFWVKNNTTTYLAHLGIAIWNCLKVTVISVSFTSCWNYIVSGNSLTQSKNQNNDHQMKVFAWKLDNITYTIRFQIEIFKQFSF